MTPMGRLIAAADALAEAAKEYLEAQYAVDVEAIRASQPGSTAWSSAPAVRAIDALQALEARTTEYRAAREAITAAGVNDMNEGKEG